MEVIKSKLSRIWKIECLKIKKKGVKNVALAYFLLFVFFYYAPIIGKSIWPQHIENKKLFQLGWSCTLPTLCTFLYSLIYLPGYLGVQAYKKYEIQPQLKPNWDRQNWQTVKWATIKNLMINYWIVYPLFVIIGIMAAGVGLRFDDFPTHLQVLKNFAIIMIADDVIYMYFHRGFHEIPGLYKYHKIHHQYEKNFSLIGQYCHPLEQLVGNIVPSMIVFMFYKTHIFVFFLWQMYKIFLSTQGHSGYEFPWSPTRILPFIYGPSYHDFHHSKNVGNYSASIYVFELLAGTNKVFFDRVLGEKEVKNE